MATNGTMPGLVKSMHPDVFDTGLLFLVATYGGKQVRPENESFVSVRNRSATVIKGHMEELEEKLLASEITAGSGIYKRGSKFKFAIRRPGGLGGSYHRLPEFLGGGRIPYNEAQEMDVLAADLYRRAKAGQTTTQSPPSLRSPSQSSPASLTGESQSTNGATSPTAPAEPPPKAAQKLPERLYPTPVNSPPTGVVPLTKPEAAGLIAVTMRIGDGGEVVFHVEKLANDSKLAASTLFVTVRKLAEDRFITKIHGSTFDRGPERLFRCTPPKNRADEYQPLPEILPFLWLKVGYTYDIDVVMKEVAHYLALARAEQTTESTEVAGVAEDPAEAGAQEAAASTPTVTSEATQFDESVAVVPAAPVEALESNGNRALDRLPPLPSMPVLPAPYPNGHGLYEPDLVGMPPVLKALIIGALSPIPPMERVDDALSARSQRLAELDEGKIWLDMVTEQLEAARTKLQSEIGGLEIARPCLKSGTETVYVASVASEQTAEAIPA